MANAGCPPKTDLIPAPGPRLRPASSKTTAAAWSLSQSRPQHSKLRSPELQLFLCPAQRTHVGRTAEPRQFYQRFARPYAPGEPSPGCSIVFCIDAEQANVCNLHGAQRLLIKRCSTASSDTNVTGDSKKSRSRPWAATKLNSPNPLARSPSKLAW